MSDGRRKFLRIAGLLLIAGALGAIGYAAYNLISTEIGVQDSLQEAEMLIEAGQMADDMSAYTGSPEDLLAPEEGQTAGQDVQPADGQPANDPAQPDVTAGPDGEMVTDAPQEDTGDASDTDKPASTGPKGTAKPKPAAYGILIFDSLGGRKVPILNGTSSAELSRGAAHHPRSSSPGAVGNCVIYGHRNTVFRSFGKLKVGDTIELEVPGKTYKYSVSSTAVVKPDDKRIFQAYGQAAMTLVTCYPFNFIGAAPDRYIVVCVLQ